MMCAVASAADSVMVMMKSVAAKPSRHKTNALPRQRGQVLFEHRQAALAVRAERGDAVVDRQRAEQRQQHQDERGERREIPGGEKRDAGLVAERGEVVDAGEAHDLPPGRRRMLDARGGGFLMAGEQPGAQSTLRPYRRWGHVTSSIDASIGPPTLRLF